VHLRAQLQQICHPERSEAPAERSRELALSEVEGDLTFLNRDSSKHLLLDIRAALMVAPTVDSIRHFVEPFPSEAFMPKYVIEREVPGAGKMTPDQLTAISQTSCGVLRKLGSEIQWVNSYVTDDKIYCVYIAPNEEIIREHARQGGFPANRVSQVRSSIDPTTAEG
jgi:hypothetical protein